MKLPSKLRRYASVGTLLPDKMFKKEKKGEEDGSPMLGKILPYVVGGLLLAFATKAVASTEEEAKKEIPLPSDGYPEDALKKEGGLDELEKQPDPESPPEVVEGDVATVPKIPKDLKGNLPKQPPPLTGWGDKIRNLFSWGGNDKSTPATVPAKAAQPKAEPTKKVPSQGPKMVSPPAAPSGTEDQNPIESIVESGEGFLVVKRPDGAVERLVGARNWRNNNPGNLQYEGGFSKSMGAIGSDGRFAIFPTYDMGNAARAKLIFSGKGYKDLTLSKAIAKYAPSHENDTGAYQQHVIAAVGGVDQKMSDYTEPEQKIILAAMKKEEGFRPGKIQTLTAGTSRPAQPSTDSESAPMVAEARKPSGPKGSPTTKASVSEPQAQSLAALPEEPNPGSPPKKFAQKVLEPRPPGRESAPAQEQTQMAQSGKTTVHKPTGLMRGPGGLVISTS